MPQVRQYPEVTNVESTDAILLDRLGTGTVFIEAVNFEEQFGINFVLGFAYNGEPLLVSQVFGQYTFAQQVTFPANFSGASGGALVLPTATWSCPIFVHPAGGSAVQMATMSWSTAGVVSFVFEVDAPYTFNIGDTIYADPSAVDLTLTNFSYTLVGSLAT